jgi:hypothetical protein
MVDQNLIYYEHQRAVECAGDGDHKKVEKEVGAFEEEAQQWHSSLGLVLDAS